MPTNLINPNPNAQPFALGIPGTLRQHWFAPTKPPDLPAIGATDTVGLTDSFSVFFAPTKATDLVGVTDNANIDLTVPDAPPAYATTTPSTQGVHQPHPGTGAAWGNMTQAQINTIRAQLIESILQVVVQLLTGGLLPGSAGPQLASWAAGVINGGLDLLSTIVTALGGFGNTLASLSAALQQIPSVNVAGQWSANLNTDLNQFLNAVATGAAGIGIPTSVAGVQTALGGIAAQLGYLFTAAPPGNSTTGLTTANSAFLAQRAANQPSYLGLDPSADPVFSLSQMTGSSPTTVPVTQAASVIGFIGTTHGGVPSTDVSTWPKKQSIAWLGSATTNITDMRLNVYRINTATGVLSLVHTSPNLITFGGGVSNTLSWNYYNIPNSSDFMSVSQTDWYAVEMTVIGTGTYNVVGIGSSWMPPHPTAYPKMLGATRATDQPPVFDAVGGPANTTAINTPNPLTWQHLIATDANCIIIMTSVNQSGGTSDSLTCGGVSVPFLGSFVYSSNQVIEAYGLMNPPKGLVNLSYSYAGGSWYVVAESQSYKGVSSIGAPTSASGVSAAPSQTITSNATQRLVNMLSSSGSPFTAYNQNQRSTLPTGPGLAHVAGDAIGTASTTFSATLPPSSPWGSYTVPLNGVVGSNPTPPNQPALNAPGGASPAYSTNIPWFALCGSAGLSQHPPDLQTFTASGVYSIPLWANHLDIIICGGGGAGANGNASFAGVAGGPGSWNQITLDKAQWSGTSITVNVGGGGPFASQGGGGNTTAVVGTFGTITANGGGGGNVTYVSSFGAGAGGPGNDVFNGNTYPGGGGGGSPQAGGGQPGGAGAGGNCTTYPGTYIYGGPGGAGIAYILAYQ